MASPDVVVVFTKNNCRVLYNPPNLEDLKSQPNVAVNPDLSKVIGVAPHFWKLVQGQIVPMSDSEMAHTESSHKTIGVDNSLAFLPVTEVKRKNPNRYKNLALVVLSCLVAILLALMLKQHTLGVSKCIM